MLNVLLGWIPIAGPIINNIINGINTFYAKKEDTALGTLQTNNATDVAVIQARSTVAVAFKNDIGVQICRDLIMFPGACWMACIFFVSIVGKNSPWYWDVLALPTLLAYIPYAIIAFLFVTAWRQ